MSQSSPTASTSSGEQTPEPEPEPELEPNVTRERYRRAMREDIDIERVAPLSYEVQGSDETYLVDLESGHCTCPDVFYRTIGCKHATKCAIHSLFTDDRRTEFVARVAKRATKDGCAFESVGCAGPTRAGDRLNCLGYPCPGCVRAIGHDDWTIWQEFH